MSNVRIRIGTGCPSGTNYCDFIASTIVEIDERLARDFVENIIRYAQQEANANHWIMEDEEE
tara:strand:+ start:3235 stop:3420 length:186 start_codon:yes stop_codon:yes gene_type:complete